MLFCYAVDEENKHNFQLESPSMWNLYILPMFTWIFSSTSVSTNIPKRRMLGSLVCLNCPSLSECGCWCCTLHGRASYPGMVPALCPGLLGQAQGTQSPELNGLGMSEKYQLLFNIRSLGIFI